MRMPTKTLTVLLPAEVLDKVDEHARNMRMPTKTLTVLLPAEVLDKVDEHARSLCLSRSAAVRLILLEEMKRRRKRFLTRCRRWPRE
jgi:metal-responsive CopG/Arc/MetJ family transcriptional regulator